MVKNSQEIDSEKAKVIIGKLINSADQSIRPVISAFELSQSRSANTKRLDQFAVSVLESCAEFLRIPLANKDGFKIFTKLTLMDRLYMGFKALMPTRCGECGEDYVIDHVPDVAPFFSCFRCFLSPFAPRLLQPRPVLLSALWLADVAVLGHVQGHVLGHVHGWLPPAVPPVRLSASCRSRPTRTNSRFAGIGGALSEVSCC